MKAHFNPFAPDRVQRSLPFEPQLADTSWEAIEKKWQQLGRRAAVIGHKGSGKTTFLKTFRGRLEENYQVRCFFFRTGDRLLQPTHLEALARLPKEENTILLVDGEGHLALRERLRLREGARHAEGYLVARHHRSQLPTLLKLQSSALLAVELFERLNLEGYEEIRERLPSLLKKKRGNLREMWLSLYDQYASQN